MAGLASNVPLPNGAVPTPLRISVAHLRKVLRESGERGAENVRAIVERWIRSVQVKGSWDDHVLPLMKELCAYTDVSPDPADIATDKQRFLERIVCSAICISDPQYLNVYFQGMLVEQDKTQERSFKDIQALHEHSTEQQSWEDLALLCLEPDCGERTITPIFEGPEGKDRELRVRLTGMNNLHAAVHYGCARVVKKLLESIRSSHPNEHLRHKVIMALDGSERNALIIAIKRKHLEIVKILVKADPELVLRPYGVDRKSPLHCLIEQALDTEDGTIPGESWCTMIEEIVKVDPARTLTSRCGKFSDWSTRGDQEPLLDATPYQVALKAHDARMDDGLEIDRLGNEENPEFVSNVLGPIKDRLEQLIWRYLEGTFIQDAGLVQYNITDLDLSDFDCVSSERQVNDFAFFVKEFMPTSGFDGLPTRLARVELPDMSASESNDMCKSIVTLFKNLAEKFQVKQIVRLFAKEGPNSWVSDDLIAQWAQTFQVEYLNWRKYDLDIAPLVRAAHSDSLHLRSLTLYTTGHEGVLHHWTSREGLPSMSQLEDITIYLVETSDTKNYVELVDWIKNRFDESLKKLNPNTDAEDRLKPRVIRTSAPSRGRYRDKKDPSLNERFFESIEIAQAEFSSLNSAVLNPFRIKIAIIDNGVSLGLSTISSNIVGGDSLLYNAYGRKIPWFTAKDPHGTHMASLITRVNPLCQLYIYRINTIQSDINIDTAAKGIQMALEAGVDIINLSWSFNVDSRNLQACLRDNYSARAYPLIFSAKSDELYSRNVYPADYDSTISVAAASSQARVSRVDKPPDLILLGEDMTVESPSYAMHQDTHISGSSASTALATGIASLILMLARKSGVRNWEILKTKGAMLDVFKRFKVDQNNDIPYLDPQQLFNQVDVLDTAIRDIVNKHA